MDTVVHNQTLCYSSIDLKILEDICEYFCSWKSEVDNVNDLTKS